MFEPLKNLDGVYTVFYRHFLSFIQTWTWQIFEGLIQPILYLVCFGYLIGSWFDITTVNSYPQFVYFGVLLSIPLSIASYELIFSSLHYARSPELQAYFNLLPIQKSDLYLASFLWAAFKSIFLMSIFMIIGTGLGLQTIFHFLPALVLGFLVAVFFASISLLVFVNFSWTHKNAGSVLYYVLPFFLFSGTFFPSSVYPVVLREIALYNPYGFAIYLLRNKSLETWTLVDLSILLGYFLLSLTLLLLSLHQVRSRPLLRVSLAV